MARAVAEAIEAQPDLGQIPPIKARDMGVPIPEPAQERHWPGLARPEPGHRRIAALPPRTVAAALSPEQDSSQTTTEPHHPGTSPLQRCPESKRAARQVEPDRPVPAEIPAPKRPKRDSGDRGIQEAAVQPTPTLTGRAADPRLGAGELADMRVETANDGLPRRSRAADEYPPGGQESAGQAAYRGAPLA